MTLQEYDKDRTERLAGVTRRKAAQSFARRFLREWGLVSSTLFLLFIIFIAVFGPVLAPYNPSAVDLENRFAKPFFLKGDNPRYILGTDSLGRDQLSRILYGARVSIIIAGASVIGAGIVGVILGAIAGFFGGWIDEVLMRIVDIGLSIPFLLLAMVISLLMGSGLLNVILVLSITGWMQFARVTRGSALKVKQETYIEAALAYGSSPLRIIFRHLIPNLMAPIIVIGSQGVGTMIYAEATLSFLGLGVPVGTPAWGGMIADGRNYLSTAWWVSTIPGIVLTLTVLAAFLVGDGLRDLLDPRLRK